MLLVVDVGNTHITLGLFDGKDLKTTFRMTAKQPRTSDEYGIQLCDLLVHRDYHVKDITDVIISSVVPSLDVIMKSAFEKYFHITPIYIGPGIKNGMNIKIEIIRR